MTRPLDPAARPRPWLLSLAAGLCLTALWSCGEVALDGLRAGEQRPLPGAPAPSPDAPEPAPPAPPAALAPLAPPPHARIFRGDVGTAVTIARDEAAFFVVEPGADGKPRGPQFRQPVVVEAGASLLGAADFAAGLVIKGDADRQVSWQLPPDADASVSDPVFDWVTLLGGRLSVKPLSGHLSSLRHARIDGTALTIYGARETKIEVLWSDITGSRVTFTDPTLTSTPPNGAIWRFASNLVRTSTLDFPEAAAGRVIEMESNNFLQRANGQTYFDLRGVSIQDFDLAAANANYFLDHSGLSRSPPPIAPGSFEYPGDDIGYRIYWLPWTLAAGRSGDLPAPLNSRPDVSRLIVDYVDSGTIKSIVRHPDDYNWLYSYSLASYAFGTLKAEMATYAAPRGAERHLSVAMSRLQGCSDIEGDDDVVLCPGDFSIDFRLSLRSATDLLDEVTTTQTFTTVAGGDVQRQIRLALLGAFDHFASMGEVLPAAPDTPYF